MTLKMNPRRYFRYMCELARPGLFLILNDRHKWAYIGYTKNILSSISDIALGVQNNTYSVKKMNEHKKFLKLSVLEIVDDELQRRLRYEHWTSHYRKLGYKMYQYKKAIEFQVKIEILPDFWPRANNLLVYVNIYNKRGEKHSTVGVFDNIDEAKNWVNTVYEPMEQIVPIVMDNTLTKEFLSYELEENKDSRK